MEKRVQREHHRAFNEQECYVCGQKWPCDAIQLADEVERLLEEKKELADQNYEFIGALLKLDADKNCTGNCKRGDGKVTVLCWRHKLLQDTLGDELSYADLRADGGLPETRAAIRKETS
jgi:hypothetical protein